MKFTTSELPLRQFEQIGLSEKDIKALPETTQNALLSGNRTALMRFTNVQIAGNKINMPLDARLSLVRQPDGTTALKIHPASQKEENTYKLSADETAMLKNGEVPFIDKKIKGRDGKVTDALISYDRLTNEFVAVDKDTVNIPEAINGTKLDEKQKRDLQNGKQIAVNNQPFRLNPNEETGLEGNAKTIDFKEGRYNANKLVLDLALIASGLGHVILLEHIARIAIKNALNVYNNLARPRFRDQVATVQQQLPAIKKELDSGRNIFMLDRQTNQVMPAASDLPVSEKTKVFTASTPEKVLAEVLAPSKEQEQKAKLDNDKLVTVIESGLEKGENWFAVNVYSDDEIYAFPSQEEAKEYAAGNFSDRDSFYVFNAGTLEQAVAELEKKGIYISDDIVEQIAEDQPEGPAIIDEAAAQSLNDDTKKQSSGFKI